MNGFTVKELIYVWDCVKHNRYNWVLEAAGNIKNSNKMDLTPHCIEIPEKDNAKRKQQLFLAPCNSTNQAQQFEVVNGMLKVKSNHKICVMWNQRDKTRLWGYPCNEHIFSEIISSSATTSTVSSTTNAMSRKRRQAIGET